MRLRVTDDIESDCRGFEGPERRSTPRLPIRVGVRFGSRDELAKAIQATTRNIGMGGLCIRTAHEYPRGAQLHVDIEFGGEVLSVDAVVAWSRPGLAIGVRFDNLTDEQRQLLADILGRAFSSSADDAEIEH
jgi:uncharacterized protein (TIGR02266 family)